MAEGTLTYLPPPTWGPWMGVPAERQELCAVEGCETKGVPNVCHADGSYHHHGCVHYNTHDSELVFRKGWGWLCPKHYQIVKDELAALRAERVKA